MWVITKLKGVTTDRRKVVEKHKRGTMLPD